MGLSSFVENLKLLNIDGRRDESLEGSHLPLLLVLSNVEVKFTNGFCSLITFDAFKNIFDWLVSVWFEFEIPIVLFENSLKPPVLLENMAGIPVGALVPLGKLEGTFIRRGLKLRCSIRSQSAWNTSISFTFISFEITDFAGASESEVNLPGGLKYSPRRQTPSSWPFWYAGNKNENSSLPLSVVTQHLVQALLYMRCILFFQQGKKGSNF